MWFVVAVVFTILGIVAEKIGKKSWDREKHPFLYWHDENIEVFGSLTAIVSGVVAIIMLFAIIISHSNVEARLEREREIYDALTYKMESTTCRDEFGFLSKEVIDEVQEWNKDVRYHQSVQDDLWFGIFYPNVYDEFETIDYESYNKG
jgi:hypothetical protein